MNARLPDDKEVTNTLERMPPYGGGWTVPWAMWVDAERRCWLHPQYTYVDAPGGTVRMRIDRTEDGYIVDTRQCPEHQWQPQREHCYVGTNWWAGAGGDTQEISFIPVAVLR